VCSYISSELTVIFFRGVETTNIRRLTMPVWRWSTCWCTVAVGQHMLTPNTLKPCIYPNIVYIIIYIYIYLLLMCIYIYVYTLLLCIYTYNTYIYRHKSPQDLRIYSAANIIEIVLGKLCFRHRELMDRRNTPLSSVSAHHAAYPVLKGLHGISSIFLDII